MSWWKIAFEKVEPGRKPVEVPEKVQTWVTQTTYGLVFGSLYGGYKGLQIAKTSTPSPVPTKSAIHRATVFFVQESILTSARIGLFVATFSALASTTEHLRNKDDPLNYGIAGGVTCGLFGGSVGGWYGAAPSAVFGCVFGGLGAYIRATLKPLVDAFEGKHVDKEIDESQIKQSIFTLIKRYETELEHHPSQKITGSTLENAQGTTSQTEIKEH